MKIWLKANVNAHDFIDAQYWHDNYESVKGMLPEATIFVYEENKEILGFVGLKEHQIAGIFVDPTKQSNGIGTALLNHVKDGYSSLSLQVYKKNKRATNFYLREGFEVIDDKVDENTHEIEYVMVWYSF